MEELKWQWWQQVDKVKCQCDSMFLALEEPMKMGLAWFVFSLSPLSHLQLKSWLLNWQFLECLLLAFLPLKLQPPPDSQMVVMLQLHTTCITIAMKNTKWSNWGRKIDGDKKESCYNWSSLCWEKKHEDMVPWSRKDGAVSTCRKLVTTMVFYSTWYSQVWFQISK